MSAFKRTVIILALLFVSVIHVFGQSPLSVSITASNNGVICSGNSIVLTASVTGGVAPYTYLWSTSENTASISANKAIPYTVTVYDNTPGSQGVKQSFTVTAQSAPDPPTAPGVIVCKGNQAVLSATAPAGAVFQWYDSNNNPLSSGDTYTTAPINAATFFYVEATLGGCTGPKTLVTVDLRADPVTTGDNICAGNTGTVKATGGDSYIWYDAPGGNQVGQGDTYTTPANKPLTATTTFYVVAITNGCSSAPIPATINVTPYPQSPTTSFSSTAVCSGTSVNLHAVVSDGGTIAWYDSINSTTPLITSPDYSTPNLTTSVTYYAENALGKCTSPRVPVLINVTPVIAPPTVTPSPATTCSGTSAVLTASSTSPGTFIWYADDQATTPLPNGTQNPFTTPILTATTTYYVQTVNNTCVSGLTPVTITVTDPPLAPTVAPVSQPCPGTMATLTAIGPGNGTYAWYDAATGGNLLFTGDTYTPTVSANTTFYVQITDATTGCTSGRTAVPVTVLPTATPPTANPVTICYNTPATLKATGSDNYQWYNVATGGTAIASGDTFTTPAPLTSSTIYYVETVINGCTSARTAVTVIVNPVPQTPTVSGTATICPGTSTPLTASVGDGGTIKWYNVATGGTLLFTGSNFSPTVNSTTTYYAEDNLGTCPGARASVTVTTTPVGFPLFTYPSATFCTSAGTVTPTVNPPGGTFSASPATLAINSTTGAINAATSPLGQYTVTFKSNNSCQTISQVTISVVSSPDASFNYSGTSFCQFGATNPAPVFTGSASAGKFTATPAGLVIDPNTGVINLQTSAPGTYDVTNTIAAYGTCPQNAKTVSGIVISPGVTVDAGPGQSIKSGASAQLAGSVVAPTGYDGVLWSGGAGNISNPNIPNPVYTPAPGETSVTLTLTTTSGSTCGKTSDQVIITILPKPANPTVVQPPPICPGNTVTLKASGVAGNYLWFTVATGGSSVFTGSTYTTPQLSTGTSYFVQVTDAAGNTSNRTQVDVVINPLPPMPTANPVVTCYNTPAYLTATGSSGKYEWYALPAGGTPLSTTDHYTTSNLSGPVSYYVQAINADGCPGPRAKVDVTITKPPVVTSAATGQVCSGSLLTYTITADIATTTYTWNRQPAAGISTPVSSGTSATISETLLNSTQNPVKVTYNITATAKGCSSTFKYVVTVNPFGTVTSLAKGMACNGQPVNYEFKFSDPGVTFKWSRAAVAGIQDLPVSDQAAPIIQESLHNTTNAPVDVTYVFNYAEGNCTGTFNYVVSVNPAINFTSPIYLQNCPGTPVNYTITANVPSSLVTYTWSRLKVNGISNNESLNQTSPIVTETLINTTNSIVSVPYYVVASAYGCQSALFTFYIGVLPTLQAPVVNSSSPVCEGKTILLYTQTAAPGSTYQWTGPNGWSSQEQNPQIPNATTANAGTYHLAIINNSCASPTAALDIVINAPNTVTVGAAQTVCITQNAIDVTGSVSGGTTTGIWSTSGNGRFLPQPPGQLNTQYLPTAQDRANGSVALTLTASGPDDCAKDSKTTVVTFGATQAVDAGTDMEACAESHAIPLNGILKKPGSATWSSSGTGGVFLPSRYLTNGGPTINYVPSAADSVAGSVKLTLTYDNASVCDIASDDVIIKLIPPPTVDAGEMKYVLKDHTTTLEPSVGDEHVQYLWTPNIGLDNNTVKNPVVTGGDKDMQYTLTITDSRGCTSKDKVWVKVSPVINVNNTFTPNGDGTNDLWTISGLEAYIDADVNVYNRLGKLLYHSVGYSKPWDGTYNGQQLPVGTYYYVIRLNVNGQVLSGSVTIIR